MSAIGRTEDSESQLRLLALSKGDFVDVKSTDEDDEEEGTEKRRKAPSAPNINKWPAKQGQTINKIQNKFLGKAL